MIQRYFSRILGSHKCVARLRNDWNWQNFPTTSASDIRFAEHRQVLALFSVFLEISCTVPANLQFVRKLLWNILVEDVTDFTFVERGKRSIVLVEEIRKGFRAWQWRRSSPLCLIVVVILDVLKQNTKISDKCQELSCKDLFRIK